MSKSWEEEDDDDECFHDSFDRLVFSSNTSCSCSPYSSEPDEEYDHYPDYSPEDDNAVQSIPVPRFPVGVCENYDLWTSQPLSVEERRLHLLHQMGLSRNSSLLRHPPSQTVLLSPDHLNPGDKSPSFNGDIYNTLDYSRNCVISGNLSSRVSVPGIVRSKSDANWDSGQNLEARSDNSVGNDCAGGIDAAVHNGNQSSGRESPVNISSFPGKPPKMKIDVDATRNGSLNSPMPASKNELDVSLECDDESGVCMIKNLDNGKEFVVNELREDGMWEKIKEVGTGRQFTMEEFSSEMSVGTSPIVQELMRRQNVEERNKEGSDSKTNGSCGSGSKMKRRGSWLTNIKNMASSVAGIKDRRSSDERETSSEKGGRRSSSATDDSQDVSFHGPERVRVRQYGKTVKELTAMYKSQEIQAHNGSIWTIKFSLDGRYLASAGEDRVVHVWQVVETEKKGDCMFDKFEDGNFNLLFLANGSPEPSSMSPIIDSHSEKKKRGRSSVSRKSLSVEQVLVSETLFSLSDKPICTFQGHSDDVLDLSWSKSHVRPYFLL